jgi:hypothetical protein
MKWTKLLMLLIFFKKNQHLENTLSIGFIINYFFVFSEFLILEHSDVGTTIY